jgi:hypothetical protein
VDRARLYSGEIKPISPEYPQNWKKYIKPFCWLILPVLSSEYYDQKQRYTEWIYALRSEYKFNSSETIIIDNIVAPPEEKPTKDMFGAVDHKFSTGKGLIKEIIHEIENTEAMSDFKDNAFSLDTISAARQIDMLREIYKK